MAAHDARLDGATADVSTSGANPAAAVAVQSPAQCYAVGGVSLPVKAVMVDAAGTLLEPTEPVPEVRYTGAGFTLAATVAAARASAFLATVLDVDNCEA